MQNKPLVLVLISVLIIALVYSSISAFNALAVPSEIPSNADCWTQPSKAPGGYITTCCWSETDPGDPEGIELEYCQGCDYDPSTKTVGDCTPKVQQGPNPPPSGPLAPLQGGVLEQPEQPLFGGQNDAGVPPTGGIEQPPTATTQPTPGGGATQGGSAEQPPQDDQNDNQGGGLPTIKNQENVPPGGGVAEQPEDEGQEDSSEGAETAGPLT
jgi:hypothetical protein